MTTVFTVGHGTRSIEKLVRVLKDAGVTRLVDVRRFPGSRRHPHFAREALERSLPAQGITYDWRGEELGGRRSRTEIGRPTRHPAWKNDGFRNYADYMDSDAFQTALEQLEADARSESLAIVCAETLWWRCHRRLISDALAVRGAEVVHLIGVGEQQSHQLHPAIRVEDGRPVYDVGETVTLPIGSGSPFDADPDGSYASDGKRDVHDDEHKDHKEPPSTESRGKPPKNC